MIEIGSHLANLLGGLGAGVCFLVFMWLILR